MVLRAAVALLLAGALLAGCSWVADPDADSAPEPDPTPGRTWPTATAADERLDRSVLDDVAAHARREGSDCFLVARHGRVVVDEAWRGTDPDEPREVFSVTKSIASTLVGIAVADGDLRLDDRVSDLVPAWRDDGHRAITVRHLLAMTSGLERPDDDLFDMAKRDDQTAYALDLPAASAPGTTWAYSNGGVQVLDAVLEAATGRSTAAFARTRLFEPLGMAHTELSLDRAGGTTLAVGAQTTCRDLARLGQLVLQRGRWGSEQVVDEDWFERATASSSAINEGYGLLWWLNVEGRRLPSAIAVSTEADEVVVTGRQVPGAPESLVWALGLGDQVLQIDPGTQTLVVRLGQAQDLDDDERFDERATARIVTEGVLDEPDPD